MTEHSHLSSTQLPSNLRRQPKQQRGKERVEKILDAAAAVFDEMGYAAATTHHISARAGTAIGSLYQFFPDKAAIFKAMELRHTERVKAFWTGVDVSKIVRLPLRVMMHTLLTAAIELFEDPISRVVFIQFYLTRDIFQSIDDSMTQDAINFLATLLEGRNPTLPKDQRQLLAEVCVHSSNAVMLAALRTSDPEHRRRLLQQNEDLLVSYLEPYVGKDPSKNVMKVMICPYCQSHQLSKNGYRRGKQCYVCKSCGKQFVNPSAQ